MGRSKSEIRENSNKDAGLKEAEQRIHQLRVFSEIGKAVTSSLNTKEILQVVMEQISDLLQPKNWSLLLLDQETQELRFEIVVGDGVEKIKDLRLKVGEGIAGWVAKEGKPLLVPDVSKDPRFSAKADSVSNFKTTSIVCVPLLTRGKTMGVIELINKVEEGHFGDDDLFLLTTIADYTAIAIDNALLFDKVQELTITDDLTRLYNSRFMHRYMDYEIERTKRSGYELSMLFMDLDFFKNINDKHGHLCGSKLLTEIGQVILHNIRSVDIACRYGGDEFVVLMPETSKNNAHLAAEKLRKKIKEAVFLKDEGINCGMTVSIGIASIPSDGKDKIELIHMADTAMYKVKAMSRDGVASAEKESA
ncbi:MAG: sensor domain-containing diguanylate cyclase [Thermodesulfobacteriota bacterium]